LNRGPDGLQKVTIPADADWVLYAPNNFEPVLIHNPFLHQLSRDIGRYSPRTRFVEVYLNKTTGPISAANYNGIYVLEEKIKIGNHRVDIDKLEPENVKPPDVTGGYVLKIDRLDPLERLVGEVRGAAVNLKRVVDDLLGREEGKRPLYKPLWPHPAHEGAVGKALPTSIGIHDRPVLPGRRVAHGYVASRKATGVIVVERSHSCDPGLQIVGVRHEEGPELLRAFDAAVAQYEQVSRTKQLPDLGHAIQEAGTKVSLLRKRIQAEARIDSLTRRRQELEVDTGDLGTSEEAPLRITALLGLFFSLGVMLILIGLFGGMYDWVAGAWQWTMFGLLVTGGSVMAKLFLEKQNEESVTDDFRNAADVAANHRRQARERLQAHLRHPFVK
jgi:hypothetical protein